MSDHESASGLDCQRTPRKSHRLKAKRQDTYLPGATSNTASKRLKLTPKKTPKKSPRKTLPTGSARKIKEGDRKDLLQMKVEADLAIKEKELLDKKEERDFRREQMDFEKKKFDFEAKQRELDRQAAVQKEERQEQYLKDRDSKFDRLFEKVLEKF